MAFYLTHRPQSFVDLEFTQNTIALELARAILKNNLSHAYLFTGTHGTGKTSTARLVAKALNCVKYAPKKGTVADDAILKLLPVPCNECESCLSITKGSFLDVWELDAASNRGIDEIRDLKEKIKLSPSSGRKKVYIIDEVHMLTNEAFNALLKTLEEPPSHAMFILCTTDLHKVPMTVQSRCTKLIFKRPTLQQVSDYILRIAQVEGIVIHADAAHALARVAGGAFRDAAKLLEQLSLQHSEISVATVASSFSTGTASDCERIVQAVATQDASALISIVHSMTENNVNMTEFMKELLDFVRELLFIKAGVRQIADTDGALALKKQLADMLHSYQLMELMDNALKALNQQKYTPLPGLPLELALLKLVTAAPTVQQVKQPIASATVTAVTPPSQIVAKTPSVASSQKSVVAKPVETNVELEEVNIVIPSAPQADAPPLRTPTVDVGSLTIEMFQNRWSELIKFIKTYNASIASLMRSCKPVALDGKILIVETHYTFHKDRIESPKNRQIIEQALFELLGAELRVKGLLTNTKLTKKDIENVREVQSDDLVAVAQEIFGT